MIGIILTGHGRFASGLYQAVCQIMGEQPNVKAIDFYDGISTELLTERLKSAVAEVGSEAGVLFLTDILGGTPFRVASLLSQELTDVVPTEVITGTNMQLAIGLLMERENLTFETVREYALAMASSNGEL